MKIGIYFSAYKSTGGVYQYSLAMLDAFKEVPEHEYVIFNISSDLPFEEFEASNWKIVNLIPLPKDGEKKTAGRAGEQLSLKRKIILKILDLLRLLHLYRIELMITNRRNKARAAQIDQGKVDMVFYPQPSELSFFSTTPSVVAVHSLQHRLQGHFPEVTAKGQYLKREFLYSNISKDAERIIVDSATTRDDMIDFWGTDPKKFEILQYLPPSYVTKTVSEEEKDRLRKKYELPDRFIFYPAQFWPHKNHMRLLEALRLLKNDGCLVNLVLSGSMKSEWGIVEQMEAFVEKNNLKNQVSFVGYIPNEDVNLFYHTTVALVMPTFFGPTPIPVIEAWRAGCPVVHSKLRGWQERLDGGAALLFDPLDSTDMAAKIKRIWTDKDERDKLIAAGYHEDESWSHRGFIEAMKEILSRATGKAKAK